MSVAAVRTGSAAAFRVATAPAQAIETGSLGDQSGTDAVKLTQRICAALTTNYRTEPMAKDRAVPSPAAARPAIAAHRLNGRHQREGKWHRPQHAKPKLGARLRICGNATGVAATPLISPGPTWASGCSLRRRRTSRKMPDCADPSTRIDSPRWRAARVWHAHMVRQLRHPHYWGSI